MSFGSPISSSSTSYYSQGQCTASRFSADHKLYWTGATSWLCWHRTLQKTILRFLFVTQYVLFSPVKTKFMLLIIWRSFIVFLCLGACFEQKIVCIISCFFATSAQPSSHAIRFHCSYSWQFPVLKPIFRSLQCNERKKYIEFWIF
jgi:hypothetical protein